MIIGKKVWAIAEGYIPEYSTGPEPQMLSHETVCILNTSSETARIEIMIYFSDKEPLGPFRLEVGARRTSHIRFNELDNPGKIPVGADFASTIISNVPIIVQHTRLDSRQAENALMSTIAYSE